MCTAAAADTRLSARFFLRVRARQLLFRTHLTPGTTS